jgi:hypothetical protein
MKKAMIANQGMTYGTRRLVAGDTFEAPRRDADLLRRIGRARYTEGTEDPLDHDKNGKKGGSKAAKKADDLTDLRKQYQDAIGKKPFAGWDAETLKTKIAEATKA